MKIDAHQHVWDLTVRDQPWTAELPMLRRSFLMEDLHPELEDFGVDGTVLVQTVTVAEETPELLTLAGNDPKILGVTGWVDLTAPGVAEAIERLLSGPGGEWLVGIRHQVQGEPDPRWLLRPDVRHGLEAVAQSGLVYELLVTHQQLSAAVEVVSLVPELRWVLDHAGKPPIASGLIEPWRTDLAALAEHPGVACKLSGMVTEAGEDWTYDHVAPYAAAVLDVFGADRVMVGSDWPVCLLRASYAEVDALNDHLLAELTPADSLKVWGGTAERWYFPTED